MSSGNPSLAKWSIYFLVAVTGAILMGIEMAGSRILAPSFGTSIFVWGSLIGLFMGSMAMGYYFGGAWADRSPTINWLGIFLVAAGVYTVVIMPYFGPGMCEALARSVTGRVAGPLVASFVLFFIPIFLMATTSPYAIKLAASNMAGLGSIAGKLYAISTIGSVFGTILTAFYLIPTFNTSKVLVGLGLAQVIVTVICIILIKQNTSGIKAGDRTGISAMTLIALALTLGALINNVEPPVNNSQRLLSYRESSYHDISVAEEVVYYDGRLLPPVNVKRWLKFNDNLESGIYPYQDKYLNAVSYTDLLHLAKIWVKAPKKMLVVGGGGAIAPSQYMRDYPSMERADILELDEEVQRVATEYFDIPKTKEPEKGVHFYIGDARSNLKLVKDGDYDVIILDAYSSGGQIPYHLLTWEFLRDIKKKLNKDGILVSNLIAAVENEKNAERPADLMIAEYKTMNGSEEEVFGLKSATPEQKKKIFSSVYIFPKVYQSDGTLRGHEDANRNIILIGTSEETKKSLSEISGIAKSLTLGKDPEVKINGEKFIWNAENLYDKTPEDEARIPYLTDDFAPVELMYRPVKKDEYLQRSY